MELNQSTPTKASEQPSESQDRKKKLTAALIGILVGIAAVLFVVNVALKKNEGEVTSSQNVNTPANTNEFTPTETPGLMVIDNANQPPEEIISTVDTSDWKTYRNEELGVEFKYPSDWRYVNEGTNYVNLNPSDEKPIHSPRIKIRVWSNPENRTLYDFYRDLDSSRKIAGNNGLLYDWYDLSEKMKEINVGNIKGVNFISPMGIVENTTVAIPVDRRIVEINFYYIEEILPKTIEEEIIDSLKLIE